MSIRIKSVSIEGMHKIGQKTTYDLANFSYLFGKNGAGKSTVLQAIQLALLGYIPGLNKTNDALFQHANGRVMAVELSLLNQESGAVAKVLRTFINNGKSTSSTVVCDPEALNLKGLIQDLELPIFNFDEFKSMTSNKLKDWFIQFLPESADEVDWEKEYRAAVEGLESVDKEEEISFYLNKVKNRRESGLSLVRAVNAELKDELSYQKGVLQRVQSTIQSLVHYDDVEEDTTVEELKSKIEADNLLLQEWSAYNRQISYLDHIKSELDKIDAPEETMEADERYTSCMKSIEDHQSSAHELSEKLAELNPVILELNSSKAATLTELNIARAQASGESVCPITKESCETASKYVDTARKTVTALGAKLEEIEAKMIDVQNQVNHIQTTHAQLMNTIRMCNAKIVELKAQYQKRDELKTQISEYPEAPSVESVEVIQSRINTNQDLLVKVSANTAYANMLESETKSKFQLELKLELLKAWIKLTDANGLQTRMMNKPFLDLQDKLDDCLKLTLGKDTTSHFYLSEKANSFSFGVKRGDTYIPFDLLSSGEKCLYTLSLMMCIIRDSSSPLKVILIDDLLDHLDTQNADKLFTSLYKIKDIQFILAGVQTCNHPQKDEIVINI